MGRFVGSAGAFVATSAASRAIAGRNKWIFPVLMNVRRLPVFMGLSFEVNTPEKRHLALFPHRGISPRPVCDFVEESSFLHGPSVIWRGSQIFAIGGGGINH